MASDITAAVLKQLYHSTGMLVVSFSSAELSLETWVATIYQAVETAHLEREAPRAYGRKVKFLRRSLREIDALSDLMDEGINILDAADEVAPIRHLVSHGFFMDFEAETRTCSFVKMETSQGAQSHLMVTHKIHLDALAAYGQQAHSVAIAASDFARRLFETLMPENRAE